MLPLPLALGQATPMERREASSLRTQRESVSGLVPTVPSQPHSGALHMFRIKVALALFVLAASIATPKVMAQDTKVMAQNTSHHSIGTHQIDRFEAIRTLQESLKSDPNDAAAWIVLGELAH